MATSNGQKTVLEFSLSAGNARFDFQFMEVPMEILGLGGKKLAALIQLEGGSRVVQTFGNVPFDAVTWKGIIFGPDSFGRWAQFDGFRTTQEPVTLTYGPFKLVGVLDEATLLPGFEGYLPYHAKFLPQAEQSTLTVPQVPPQTVDQSGAAATSQVTQTSLNAEASPVQVISDAGTQAQAAALAVQQAIGQSLTAALITAPGTVGTAAAQVTTALSTVSDLLQTEDPIDIINTVLPLFIALSALSNVLESQPTQYQVTVLSDGRLNNLFQLAARYFSGPDDWVLISNANGGLSPFWTGLLSVVIPAST